MNNGRDVRQQPVEIPTYVVQHAADRVGHSLAQMQEHLRRPTRAPKGTLDAFNGAQVWPDGVVR